MHRAQVFVSKFLKLALCLGLGTSCSLFLKSSDTDMKDTQYSLRGPTQLTWKPVARDTADFAWAKEEGGINLVANSYCKKYQTTTLESLTEHLFHGVLNFQIIKQDKINLYGREGLKTQASGHLDGVKVFFLATVFNRDNCTYDLTLIKAASFEPDEIKTYEQTLTQYEFKGK